MSDIFSQRNIAYKLRSQTDFKLGHTRTVHNGLESLKYLGPKIWDLVPPEMKKLPSVEIFKERIKTWIPKKCPCKLCRTYVSGVGYLD